jgi:FkbM family methyltransferase
MVRVMRGYFATILHCLKEGKIRGALLQSFIPLLSLSNTLFKKLHYSLIQFSHRKGEREIIVEINKRYKMYLSLDDTGIGAELMVNKTREVFSTNYFQKIISENMIVIDIGANIGYYALLESQLASKGHIYAIEPVLKNYTLLTKNIALNQCSNISTYNFAIGNTDGFSKMYIYDKSNWSSFTKIPGENIRDIVQVPVFTLDTFIESHVPQNPHFIRMDVEGFEYEILMGSVKTLRTAVPLIFCIEMHPHLMSREKVIEIMTLMKENGFGVSAIFNDMNASELKFIDIFNRLQNILALPSFGYIGNTYTSLEQIMEQGEGAIVFFEKPAVH